MHMLVLTGVGAGGVHCSHSGTLFTAGPLLQCIKDKIGQGNFVVAPKYFFVNVIKYAHVLWEEGKKEHM